MAAEVTKKTNVIIPEVMGDMIEAKLPHMLKFTAFAKVDTTLVGVPGDTKTVPSWNFVGAAEDVAEGAEIATKKLTASSTKFTIKKAMQSIGITQESINSGLGDPVGQGESQLAKAIAVKVDADVLAALLTSAQTYGTEAPAKIGYAGIVDAVDVFDEEEITDKVMFVNPKQVTVLRKDADFMDKNKYGNEVMVSGEIGMIAGTRIVPTKQIVQNESGNYVCPIVKLEPASADTEYAETELPAVTIFMKADTSVDHEWFPKKQTHDITAAKYYGAALTNAAKVVLATFKA
jgi:N4-gp56 family major capsid protein